MSKNQETSEEQKIELKKQGLMPIRKWCPHCHKSYEQGYVHAESWPIEEGFLCQNCQEQLGVVDHEEKTEHTTLTFTKYPPTKYKMVTGNCTLCNAFPCKHIDCSSGEWHIKKEPDK